MKTEIRQLLNNIIKPIKIYDMKQKNIFQKLFAAIKAESEKNFLRFVNELNELKEVAEITKVWYYRELMSKGKQTANWELQPLKDYLISRRQKKDEKELQTKLAHLEMISEAGELVEINVSVEWKKNRTWGANPTATADFNNTSNWQRYNSASISGCGYDKNSTAVAQAINQSPELLKALYLIKEQSPDITNKELFGYGSGYGILPRFEGGVGVECYPDIFAKIGMEWRRTGSGKMFDVYTVTKKY